MLSHMRLAYRSSALEGRTAEAKLLLQIGADVNAVTSEGDSALHSAADIGNAELVALLLEAGANVKTVSSVRVRRICIDARPKRW